MTKSYNKMTKNYTEISKITENTKIIQNINKNNYPTFAVIWRILLFLIIWPE